MFSSFYPAALLVVAVAALEASIPPLKYTAVLGDGASISSIAVDSSGSVYVTGSAAAALPTTPGAYYTPYKPATCPAPAVNQPCPVAFAAKLTPDGTGLIYLTYLGISNGFGSRISVDAQGNAWITGSVSSYDLPVTPGALQSAPVVGTPATGLHSAFVLKLSANGSQVLYATYLGSATYIGGQAVDSRGNLYFAGADTGSQNFPATSGAFQTSPGPQLSSGGTPTTAFAGKFDPVGKLTYLTWFHGTSPGSDSIAALAVDGAGNAYFTGYDTSGSLPTTPRAFQTNTAKAGTTAAFVAKLDPAGGKLVYCTYLVEKSAVPVPDQGTAIAVDNQGDAYVAGDITGGFQNPPNDDFPAMPGEFQILPPEFQVVEYPTAAFLTKLDTTGSFPLYSTWIGWDDSTEVSALAVDATGAAVVLGNTFSSGFPATPGALVQCAPGGQRGSPFLLKLSPNGSQAQYATYFGSATSLALDASGEVYLAGTGTIDEIPMVPGSFGWTAAGEYDGFVVALAPEPLPVGTVSCVVSAASRGGAIAQIPVAVPAIAPGEIVDIFGNGIGPAEPVSAPAVSAGLPIALGGVEVLFDGYPAPLLSAGPNQIRAIVPYETVNYTARVDVQVLSDHIAVGPFTTKIAPQVPSIFTLNGTPEGQALMINQDGTLNSAGNPAPQGSTVTVYATGLGNTDPPLATGAIATAAAPLALASKLTIIAAYVSPSQPGPQITYAGAAPGFAAGLVQINFKLPDSGPAGWVPLNLSAGGAVSQYGVYFYEQGHQ